MEDLLRRRAIGIPGSFPSDVDEDNGAGCPKCEGGLTLHQPDPGLPERLLGTCDECKTWYLFVAGRCVEIAPAMPPADPDAVDGSAPRLWHPN